MGKSISLLITLVIVVVLAYSLLGANGNDMSNTIGINKNEKKRGDGSSSSLTTPIKTDHATKKIERKDCYLTLLVSHSVQFEHSKRLVKDFELQKVDVKFKPLKTSSDDDLIKIEDKTEKDSPHMLYHIRALDGEYELILNGVGVMEHREKIVFDSSQDKRFLNRTIFMSLGNYKLSGTLSLDVGGEFVGFLQIHKFDENDKDFQNLPQSGMPVPSTRYFGLALERKFVDKDGIYEMVLNSDIDINQQYILTFMSNTHRKLIYLDTLIFSSQGEHKKNDYTLMELPRKIVYKLPENIIALSEGEDGTITIKDKKTRDVGYASYTDQEGDNNSIIRTVEKVVWRTAKIKVVDESGNPLPYPELLRKLPTRSPLGTRQQVNGAKDGSLKIRFADFKEAVFELYVKGYKVKNVTLSNSVNEIEEIFTLEKK